MHVLKYGVNSVIKGFITLFGFVVLAFSQLSFSQVYIKNNNYIGTQDTLCIEGEDIYFSCPILNKKKILSVCGAGNKSPLNGYVQYRYGTLDKLDFQYPGKLVAPKGIFKLVDVTQGSIKGGHLKFSNRNKFYVVTSIFPGGVYVEKDKKIILDDKCDHSGNNSFSYKASHGIDGASMDDVDDYDAGG